MKNKIQDLQFFAMMFFIMRSSYMTIVSPYNLKIARENSFYSLLIGLLLGIIPILIFYYIFKNSKKDIISTIHDLFNKNIVGAILNYSILIIVMIYSVITFDYMVDFAQTTFLDKTPKLYISILLILPILYSLNHNIKTLARFTLMLLYISIVFI
ncbi:MAG TPA: GerAB/ArcD/ProY family transporter, partial [Tenericutes bacterium]|nr:GerAB/ArcD/ProY family transporter [Mycoplasmatota bacterium]